jgi:hypothetical protein
LYSRAVVEIDGRENNAVFCEIHRGMNGENPEGFLARQSSHPTE